MLLLDYMSIYIKRFCLVLLSFDCSWGTNILNIWGGQTFYIKGGGESFLHRGWDKHFMLKAAVALMMLILM